MNFCSLFGGLRVGARRKGKWGKEMGAGRKFFCGEVKWTSLVLLRRRSVSPVLRKDRRLGGGFESKADVARARSKSSRECEP